MTEAAQVPEELLAHSAFVRRLAGSLLQDPNDVDDVLQETWMATVLRPPPHGRNPQAWLARVTRNFALRERRGVARREEHERTGAREVAQPSFEGQLASEELCLRLVAAVRSLDDLYRAVIFARYYEGLPPREIARRLAIPVETVRTREKRALAQLRARLQDLEEDWRSALSVLVGTEAATEPNRGRYARSLSKRAWSYLAAAALLLIGVELWSVRPALRSDAGSAPTARAADPAVEPDLRLLTSSHREPAMSFTSEATLVSIVALLSLLPASGNEGVTRLVSVGFDAQGNAAVGDRDSRVSCISADGRYVAFASKATNLLPQGQDTNGLQDVFVRDLLMEQTFLVSRPPGFPAVQANGASSNPAMTPDGAFLVFDSAASNLGPTDDNGVTDIYRVALGSLSSLGAFELMSWTNQGMPCNGNCYAPSVSDDGTVVAFSSDATNLTTNSPNVPGPDIYLRDVVAGTTVLVSADSNGVPANRNANEDQALSGDGRFVTYWSNATNLDPADDNDAPDVFVFDREDSSTRLVSKNLAGDSGGPTGLASWYPCIDHDGHYISFLSEAPDLVPDDTNGAPDIFVRDMWTGENVLVSLLPLGDPATSFGLVDNGTMTADGRFLTFYGGANVGPDTNNFLDVYLIDRDRDDNGVFDTRPRTKRVSVGPRGEQGDEQSVQAGLMSAISRNGNFVVFESQASNFAAPLPDASGPSVTYDVFVRDMRHVRHR